MRTKILGRFELVGSLKSIKESQKNNPYNLTTLSITPNGRLNLPSFVIDYYKLNGEYFTAYYDHKKQQFLILFHCGKVENSIKFHKSENTYLKMAGHFKSCGYSVKKRIVKFRKYPYGNGIIIDLKP